MNKIFCSSFTEIIQTYISHMKKDDKSNHMLISSDIPSDRCIGFSCCNDHFLIKVSSLLGRQHRLRDQRWSSLLTKDKILSSTGRIDLANIFNQYIKTSIRDLDKYLELKYFGEEK